MISILVRPMCKSCGNNPCARKGRKSDGISPKYKSRCYNCARNKYRRTVKIVCDLCGFKAINKCQMDVDHIDGNHANNLPDNLQSLCANCHRLKTFINRSRSFQLSL